MNMKSVNQINAQIKLSEMWKSTNIINYPIKTNKVTRPDKVVHTRAVTQGHLMEDLLTTANQKTFINDAIHIWNKAPVHIKQGNSLSNAKLAIKSFVLTITI